jgi:transcriptional regulator with GAF, ATPase, and Fis domain
MARLTEEDPMRTINSNFSLSEEHVLTTGVSVEVLETQSDAVDASEGRATVRGTNGLKLDLGDNEGVLSDLRALPRDLTSLGRRVIKRQENELSSLARELREGILQAMSTLRVELDQLDSHIPRSAEEMHAHVRQVRQRVSDIATKASGMCRESCEQPKMRGRQLELENGYRCDEIALEQAHSSVIGNSAAIRNVLRQAEQVAATDSTVLVLGETGTGKELIAQRIHEMSGRSARPMVKTNCAALPATLVESELFGREKGAYTGALSREVGRFELADNSTIFLDEIGEVPIELQAKLLRVLQEGTFERLGSSKTIHVNVRVIAATSRDLTGMVRDGRFREDLFYRLNVFPIVVPPLRDRLEDLPSLVWHMLTDLGKKMGKQTESVGSSTLQKFRDYSWPGNVRELRNVIERYLILNKGPIFRAEVPASEVSTKGPSLRLDEIERLHVREVLERVHWRVRGLGGAAEILGLKATTLEARMKKLGIVRSA